MEGGRSSLFLLACSFIFFEEVLSATILNPHFSYNLKASDGPDQWDKIWPVCGGRSQSPININTSRVHVNHTLNIQYQPVTGVLYGVLKNNGHVPEFSIKSAKIKPVLTGVPHHEGDEFVLEQLHLHFHSNNKVGSEHTIDGKYSSGEFHLVHYNRKYGSFSNAAEKPDGLTVIAVFVKDLGQDTPLYVEELVVETEETLAFDSTLYLSLNPTEFLPTNKSFYTYTGSLTTPACQESVTWVVMATPISVPSSDMEQLRQMKDSEGRPISLYGNCRPQTDIGTRLVEANFN